MHEEVDRDGVDRAIGDADVHGPVFAVQRGHGLLPASSRPAQSLRLVLEAAPPPVRHASSEDERLHRGRRERPSEAIPQRADGDNQDRQATRHTSEDHYGGHMPVLSSKDQPPTGQHRGDVDDDDEKGADAGQDDRQDPSRGVHVVTALVARGLFHRAVLSVEE